MAPPECAFCRSRAPPKRLALAALEAPIETDRRADRVRLARDARGDARVKTGVGAEPVRQTDLGEALAREASSDARAKRDELDAADRRWKEAKSRPHDRAIAGRLTGAVRPDLPFQTNRLDES